jgi:hypothetical protein
MSSAKLKRNIWGEGVQRTSILMLHDLWMMPKSNMSFILMISQNKHFLRLGNS